MLDVRLCRSRGKLWSWAVHDWFAAAQFHAQQWTGSELPQRPGTNGFCG